MHTGAGRRLGNARGQVEGRGAEHRELAGQSRFECAGGFDVEFQRLDRFRQLGRAELCGQAVDEGYVIVAGGSQHLGDGRADLAGADNYDVLHDSSLALPFTARTESQLACRKEVLNCSK